jgi:GAF domain-containing protein
VHSPDLTVESRFGSYPNEMLARNPIRSVLSFGLRLHDKPLGVLTLYARRPSSFDAAAIARAAVLADHAAVDAATSTDRADNLQIALTSSRLIGTALASWSNATKSPPHTHSICFAKLASTPTAKSWTSPTTS